jgi:hypothetical protein
VLRCLDLLLVLHRLHCEELDPSKPAISDASLLFAALATRTSDNNLQLLAPLLASAGTCITHARHVLRY